MNIREEVIKNLTKDEDRVFASKIIDCVQQVQKNYEPEYTEFLDPYQLSIAKKIIENFVDIKYLEMPGLSKCERNIVAVFPDYLNIEEILDPIAILKIIGKSKFESINHRDILGALMSMGIRREKIGDIIITDEGCYVFICKDISYYIIMNLNKIKHSPVEVDYGEIDDISSREGNLKIIASSVASLRLDCIMSLGFGESRTKISKEIISGGVKVNYKEVFEPSYNMVKDDLISFKGRGRIILDEVTDKTKKGRIKIVIKKLI